MYLKLNIKLKHCLKINIFNFKNILHYYKVCKTAI